MRTWERVFPNKDQDFAPYWQEVSTTANGFDDYVWAVTLIQCLLLNLGESPFFATYGIPAQQSVLTQIFPDFYVNQTQQQFSQYFASLIITRLAAPDPTYVVNIVTNQGAPVILELTQPQAA